MHRWKLPGVALGLALAIAAPVVAQNSSTGAIEFTVAASPSGGRPQPAPRLPVFLLSKSFSAIQDEAEKEVSQPDMKAFIDSLDVSPELKAWMQKKKTVRLSGPEFIRSLSTDDVMTIPEIWEAYLTRNAQDVTVGFPKAKFKITDPAKDPVQYNQERKEYRERVKKYLTSYQHTKEGIDLHLVSIDPSQRWARKEIDRQAEVRQRILQLAQSRFLVAKGETDLQGRGGFVHVTPGAYWLSTLEGEAVAGDARLRWDLPIEVRANSTTQVELSNVNALPRQRKS